jgi:hypothetical protein
VDVAPDQRQMTRGILPISIGESYDIELAPKEPGKLSLRFVASNGAIVVDLPLEVAP